jgi:CRISPR-associated protein Cas5d
MREERTMGIGVVPYPPLEVKVWGDIACFTRPELKVERVSYEVMTPSAARGLLEAVMWKPEMQWRIREIRVLKPIRYISMMRNEVSQIAVTSTARGWGRDGGRGGYFADDYASRTQRHTLALRDVAYVIVADIVVRVGVDEDPAKYRDQFRRRLDHGQYYISPCLGCREFAAHMAPVDGTERSIERSGELGRMLFDMDYAQDGSGRGQPRFFDATLDRGVMRVPPALYEARERRLAR